IKLTPWSRALATIVFEVASSVAPPNIMVPRQSCETFRPLTPSLRYSMATPSPRGHGIAEGERRIDPAQRLDAVAGAANDDVAIVEDAPEDRLIDIDALDFVHVHFDRVAADEAGLVNDAAVGHVDLSRPPPEPGAETRIAGKQRDDQRSPIPNRAILAAGAERDQRDRHRP